MNQGGNCFIRRISPTQRKKKIISSLKQAIESPDLKVETNWGDVIEDRGSQITFSGLGQQAPLEEKKKWDPDFIKRKKIKALLDKLIPEFSVRLGGATSIDVTKHGIDKAYGIRKLRDVLGIAIRDDLSSETLCSRVETIIRPRKRARCPLRSKILMRRSG
jgi:phosphomannomutase